MGSQGDEGPPTPFPPPLSSLCSPPPPPPVVVEEAAEGQVGKEESDGCMVGGEVEEDGPSTPLPPPAPPPPSLPFSLVEEEGGEGERGGEEGVVLENSGTERRGWADLLEDELATDGDTAAHVDDCGGVLCNESGSDIERPSSCLFGGRFECEEADKRADRRVAGKSPDAAAIGKNKKKRRRRRRQTRKVPLAAEESPQNENNGFNSEGSDGINIECSGALERRGEDLRRRCHHYGSEPSGRGWRDAAAAAKWSFAPGHGPGADSWFGPTSRLR